MDKIIDLLSTVYRYFDKEVTPQFIVFQARVLLAKYDADKIEHAVEKILVNERRKPENLVAIIIDYIDPPISPDKFIASMQRKNGPSEFTILEYAYYRKEVRDWSQLKSSKKNDLFFGVKAFLEGKRESDDRARPQIAAPEPVYLVSGQEAAENIGKINQVVSNLSGMVKF